METQQKTKPKLHTSAPAESVEIAPKASRALLYTILGSFLVVAAGVPLIQAGHEVAVDHEMPYLVNLFTALPGKAHWHGWDQTAKDKSIFSKAIRTKMQQLEYDWMGYTGPKAIEVKRDGGWLFYTPDVQYLIQAPWNDERFTHGTVDTMINGRQVNLRDPIPAILDYRDRLKARGIELLMMPVPGKPSIYPEKLDPAAGPERVSPTEGLIAEMRRRGLEVVDLFTPMKAAKAKGGAELYLRTDTHWTPAGLEVAATALADRIKTYSWFDKKAPGDSLAAVPRYAEKEVDVERYGDIGEMTALPNRKITWPKQKTAAMQVIDQTTQKPYVDSDSSDILYLGDSFSRIFQTDDPKSAGVISHLAMKLNRPLSSIVNDGGASTVVRKQLLRKGQLLKGKKLVVWEFVERDIRFGEGGWQFLDLPDAAQ